VRRSLTPEIGWIELEILRPNELFDGFKSRLNMFALHFDEVINLPQPWIVLAQSARCAVQVMRYGDRPVFGIQAHPEITPERARMLMKGLAKRAPEHISTVEKVLAGRPKDDELAGEIVRRFLAL